MTRNAPSSPGELACTYLSSQASSSGPVIPAGPRFATARTERASYGGEVASYRFEEASVFEHDFGERFDVVFCLGLLYHVSKPMELFEVMAGVGAEVMVIDTIISPSEESVFKVRHEPVDHWLN